jgi:hypothetical protein
MSADVFTNLGVCDCLHAPKNEIKPCSIIRKIIHGRMHACVFARELGCRSQLQRLPLYVINLDGDIGPYIKCDHNRDVHKCPTLIS